MIKKFNLLCFVSLGPQKLFEVQRIHGDIFLIAYAIGLDFLIADPHEGTRANDIVPPVLLESFEAGRTIRARLQLIEENKRLSGLESKRRILERDISQNRIHLVPILENRPILLLQGEIDFYHILIIFPRKVLDGLGLPDLPRPFHDQRHPLRIPPPRQQAIIQLPSQSIHHKIPHFSYAFITEFYTKSSVLSQKSLFIMALYHIFQETYYLIILL